MKRRFLTPAQVAELLSLSTITLAHWRVAGTGPRYLKVGGRIRYAEEDVEAYSVARTRSSTTDTGDQAATAAN